MKIEFKNSMIVSMRSLSIGDCFMAGNRKKVFMKITKVIISDSCYNAIDLSTGDLEICAEDGSVRLCECKIVVKDSWSNE